MSQSKKVELFQPPNPLAGNAALLPGVSVEDLYAKAEASLETVRGETMAALEAQTASLRYASEAVAPGQELEQAGRDRIGSSASILRELAGSLEYPLISKIANSLHNLVAGSLVSDPRAVSVIKLHVDAIEAVLRDDLRQDGGETGADIVASLREAVRRFSADQTMASTGEPAKPAELT